MAENVRFIRKHGRIIPIRAKQPEQPKIVAPVVAAAAATATYLALRKFRISANPALARLQKLVAKKGVSVTTPAVKTKLGKGVVRTVFGFNPNVKGSIPLNIYTGFRKSKGAINPAAISDIVDDKLKFAKIMGNLSPKTKTFLQGVKGNFKGVGKDFLVKPRAGANMRVEQFMTKAEMFNLSPKLRKPAAMPNHYLMQEKLNIQQEFRAHIVNNEVFGISYRRLPKGKLRSAYAKVMGKLSGGGAFIPVMGKDRAEVAKLAQKVGKKISAAAPGKNYFVALDIAKTPKGFKVIEGNTSPGTIGNPLISRKLAKLVTGRTPKELSIISGAGAGAATYAALKPKEKKNVR